MVKLLQAGMIHLVKWFSCSKLPQTKEVVGCSTELAVGCCSLAALAGVKTSEKSVKGMRSLILIFFLPLLCACLGAASLAGVEA